MIMCPFKVDPLTPHFYTVKLGFTEVNFSFFYSCIKTLIVGPRSNRLNEAVLTCTLNLCFKQKRENNLLFSAKNYHFKAFKITAYCKGMLA